MEWKLDGHIWHTREKKTGFGITWADLHAVPGRITGDLRTPINDGINICATYRLTLKITRSRALLPPDWS